MIRAWRGSGKTFWGSCPLLLALKLVNSYLQFINTFVNYITAEHPAAALESLMRINTNTFKGEWDSPSDRGRCPVISNYVNSRWRGLPFSTK